MKKIYFIGIALCILLVGGIISRIIIDGQNNPEHLIEVENSNAGTIITRVQTDDGLFETNVAKAGQEVYVEFILNPGYELDELHVNGADLIDGKFVMPWAGVSIQIEYTLITYHINFHTANSQRITTGSPIQYTVESNYTLPEVDEYDKTYLGWCFNEDLSDEPITTWSNMTGDYDLYPKMTDKVYNITYVLYGGQNSASNKTSYISTDNTITLYNPTKQGYIFEGWYKNKSDFTKKVSTVSTISPSEKKDITLYAEWVSNKYDGQYRTIESAVDFVEIMRNPENCNGKFKLISDIDLINFDASLIRIGSRDNSRPFTGIFDGNGHTISNITSNTIYKDSGLFNYCSCATIKNINFTCNLELNDKYLYSDIAYVGTLVGSAYDNTLISNCHVNNSKIELNTCSDYMAIGFLVGHGYGACVYDCSAINCNISGIVGRTSYVGYISGWAYELKRSFASCSSNSSINLEIRTQSTSSPSAYVGGLAGYMYNTYGKIENSYYYSLSQNTVISNYLETNIYLGGVIGALHKGKLQNCYSYITSLKAVASEENSAVYVGALAGIVTGSDESGTEVFAEIKDCLSVFNTSLGDYGWNIYAIGLGLSKTNISLMANCKYYYHSTNNMCSNSILVYDYNRAVVDPDNIRSSERPSVALTVQELYEFANQIATDEKWIKNQNELPYFN